MKPQVDLFLSFFWRKLKTQKRHFEIIWPLRTMKKECNFWLAPLCKPYLVTMRKCLSNPNASLLTRTLLGWIIVYKSGGYKNFLSLTQLTFPSICWLSKRFVFCMLLMWNCKTTKILGSFHWVHFKMNHEQNPRLAEIYLRAFFMATKLILHRFQHLAFENLEINKKSSF